MNLPKILVIVGPTASGKTSLSIQLAKKFNGEIVSADSRQVYKGLDIGTGKVTQEEMQGVQHHMLDVADPQTIYTVADFVRDGRSAIGPIFSRNKLPIVVGGTFLYVDALLGDVSMPEVSPNESLRTELESKSLEDLISILSTKDPKRAQTIDTKNKRRIIRAIEIAESLGKVPPMEAEQLYTPLFFGMLRTKEELKENIYKRLMERLDRGMIEEVQVLHKNGLSFERLGELGIEYKYIGDFLQGNITKEEMCIQIETKSMQYAKRQMTWLKRNGRIVWIRPDDVSRIEGIIAEFLGK